MNAKKLACLTLYLVLCAPCSVPCAEAWRELVEADWQRQDESRLRELREPGQVWLGQTQIAWGGVDTDGGLVVPKMANGKWQIENLKWPEGGTVTLDGVLDEPAWQNAASIPAGGPGEPAYRLGHDGERLYVAVSLPTQAESRFTGGPTAADAAGAVDGVKNGLYAFHTNWEPNPWWQVDLGKPQPIGKIVVYNRLDYQPGLHYADLLTILTSDDGQQWTLRYDNQGKHFDGVSGVGPLVVEFPLSAETPPLAKGRTGGGEPVTARFVRLQLASPNPIFFHLDEVEIYPPDAPDRNIALHRPAQQSSLSIWSKGGVLGSVLCGFGGRTLGFTGDEETGKIGNWETGKLAATFPGGVRRHEGITTVELALPLHDAQGRFPGQITVAGGQTVPLQLAGDWQLVWPEEPQPGFGRNRLTLQLLSPPMSGGAGGTAPGEAVSGERGGAGVKALRSSGGGYSGNHGVYGSETRTTEVRAADLQPTRPGDRGV